MDVSSFEYCRQGDTLQKYDYRAFGHPLEVVFRGFMEIELEVKFLVFFITSFFKLRSRAFNCQIR